MRHLLDEALRRRAPLPDAHTDALRLIDAEGDGLPGFYLETFAGHWLASTSGTTIPHPIRSWLEDSGHSVYHKQLDQHQKESPAHICGPAVEGAFLAKENDANFEISFESGYSQGIFLDQRDNRKAICERMAPGQTLLNTFSYTGAFSVVAALGGAETTTLDLSQVYLDWAKRNFTHNGLDPTAHYYCKGDTFHWLRRFAKQGRKFDAIVLDPPTFSRDDKGKVFRVERDYAELAALALDCLQPGGFLLCCTNLRTLSHTDFDRQLHDAARQVRRKIKTKHSPMPSDFTGDPYLKSVWVEG